MNIMNEYTFHHLRKNKRHTISIMIAITIAATLLCSLSIFGHTLWKARITSVIKSTGYWHGELWDVVRGEQLKYVTENPTVKATMVKGQWVTAKLSNTKRPYLLMRDADANYWKDMSEKNSLMEGRLPKKQGEIVLSKLFFKDNPNYKIGDTLNLPIGKRMMGNTEIETQKQEKEGETFEVSGHRTYTIVGKLDVAAISVYPGYIAMGYLDHAAIQPEDGLTVYMRMENPRKIYETLPNIAKKIGFQPDEYGEYLIRYNTRLLMLYGILDKDDFDFGLIASYLTFILIALLSIGAFVLIIYNAFSLSASARMKQLGILKSLGATPKQIRWSVLYEGIILCLLPIPVGIIFGYLFSNIVIYNMNGILGVIEGYTDIQITFSWIVVLIGVLMSLITVLLSAYIPARKTSKILPIEAVRQNNDRKNIKKAKSHPLIKRIFGVEGELAMSSFGAHKRSFRTAVISLSMCFVLVAGYICTIRIADLSNESNEKSIYFDLSLSLFIRDDPSAEMIKKIRSIPEVKESMTQRITSSSTYVEKGQESEIFANTGGFAQVDPHRFNVLQRDGKYRINVNILGLDDDSFKRYCKEIGVDVDQYSQKGIPKGVLVNSTYHQSDALPEGETRIPLLNIKKGETFHLWEKTSDAIKSNYQFDMEVGYITEILPNVEYGFNRYGLIFVVPMKVYEEIVSPFMPDRALAYNKIRIDLVTGDEASPKVKEELIEICSGYLGTEDFKIWSKLENKAAREATQEAIKIGFIAVGLMLGAIGVSNAFTTTSNNLKLRRREFAMLRSTGLTPKGLDKILVLEGLFFGFNPILISIPFLCLVCWFMLWATNLRWLEFLPVFPIGEILLYAIVIIGSIWTAYGVSAKRVKRENVVDGIRDETL